jgi:N-acetylneuraminic acid mutarotase
MDNTNVALLLKPVKWRGAMLAGLVCFATSSAAGQENPVPPSLPQPVSNNAVAEIIVDGVQHVMSFMGIGPAKTYQDVSREAWLWTSESREWRKFPDVPVDQGRLASVAVGINNRILLFGGYTVAADGAELSTPEVFAIDPLEQSYERRADMPVPVDDTVAFPFANRYVYLVSGWHDTGNVGQVQRYDTLEDSWTAATAFPGVPVFGHAGGIVGNTLIVVGGVGVIAESDGKREFGAIDQAWKGTIDPANPARIQWQAIPLTAGTNRYRMAATGVSGDNRIYFAGGTERPYNFSGIGYDGEPAEPTDAVFAFDIEADQWIYPGSTSRSPTMDHRGLLRLQQGTLITIGGMGLNQQVLSNVTAFDVNEQKLSTKSELQPKQ